MTHRKPTNLRRTEIADAALDLVARHGIADLTTRALAEAVGLTGGALFKHYATRDDLLVGMVERATALLRATFPDEALPPRDRLQAFRAARLALVTDRGGVLRLVLSEQLALALPPTAAAALRGAVADTHAFLTRALADGQREGVIRGDVPAAALAHLMMGAMQITALTQVGFGPPPSDSHPSDANATPAGPGPRDLPAGALDALDRLLTIQPKELP